MLRILHLQNGQLARFQYAAESRWGAFVTTFYPRLAPWAAFCRRSAASGGNDFTFQVQKMQRLHVLTSIDRSGAACNTI
jgi:hypothetical protein